MAHAQVEETPDHPSYNNEDTAGAPLPQTPRWNMPYRGYEAAYQVTPDHPEYDPSLTAGAEVPAQPRFGTAYNGGNRKEVEGQVAAQTV